MKKIALMMVAAVLVITGVLFAQSVHFVKGPDVSDVGTQLLVQGKLAGLGEGDVTIIVDGFGLASVECTNPGGNVAPGQDTEVTSSGSITLPTSKNGHVNFSVLTETPDVPNYPTCPNQAWSAEVLDVAFSGGTITVLQGGVIVLQQAL